MDDRSPRSPSTANTEMTQERLRALNLSLVTGSLSAVGALLVASEATAWWEIVALTMGLLTALVALSLWAAGRAVHVVLPCLVIAGAVWVFGVLAADNTTGVFGFAVVGTIVCHQLPRHRRAVIAGLVAFAAAVIAARLVFSDGGVLGVLARYVVVSAGIATVPVILMSLHKVVSGLATRLEEARQREAELVVTRERMRFASDLHDIQGHTLHVVKLKTALARKLVRSDTERAEEELLEIQTMVGDTITQTKELAYAQRRLNLSVELENAKNLFRAAGIRVRVVREDEVDDRVGELLGQVLRETTTNILRHAQAQEVRITLTESGITIVNDGVQGTVSGLRGLSTLRERVADAGGELTVEREDGRFLTAAVLPSPGSDAAPQSTEGRS